MQTIGGTIDDWRHTWTAWHQGPDDGVTAILGPCWSCEPPRITRPVSFVLPPPIGSPAACPAADPAAPASPPFLALVAACHVWPLRSQCSRDALWFLVLLCARSSAAAALLHAWVPALRPGSCPCGGGLPASNKSSPLALVAARQAVLLALYCGSSSLCLRSSVAAAPLHARPPALRPGPCPCGRVPETTLRTQSAQAQKNTQTNINPSRQRLRFGCDATNSQQGHRDPPRVGDADAEYADLGPQVGAALGEHRGVLRRYDQGGGRASGSEVRRPYRPRFGWS